jgi:hypothetical protein
MSNAINQRVEFLEQRLEVLQAELNTVLKEMQVTIEGLAKLTQVGIGTLNERITKLEIAATTPTPMREDTEGKEL